MPDDTPGAADCLGRHQRTPSKWLTHPTFNTALMELCVHIAIAIARQWFGGVVVPANTTDCWVVEGLANTLAASHAEILDGDERVILQAHVGHAAHRAYGRRRDITAPRESRGEDGAVANTRARTPPLGAHRAAAGVERALASQGGDNHLHARKTSGAGCFAKGAKYFAGLHVRRNKKEQATRVPSSAEVLARPLVIHTQQLFDHCRATVNLGKGEVNSFLERWVYGAGVPETVRRVRGEASEERHGICETRRERLAAADRAALAVARNHRSSITVRMREEHRPDANDHVVSLGHSSWQLMDICQPRLRIGVRRRSSNPRGSRAHRGHGLSGALRASGS